MRMLKSFLEKIRKSDTPALRKWITGGLIAYHDPQSPAFRCSESAFEGADLSFGHGGPHATAVTDLIRLFENLDDTTRENFNEALARSIELLPITDERKHETLRDMIEIALETKNSYALGAVIQKLSLPDAEVRRIICLDAVYFLEESHAQADMLKLGREILEKVDFPYEISAHLLVGLCRLDVNRSVEYATSIEIKLKKQLDTLRNYTEQYERFRGDFAKAVLSAPNESEVVAGLLCSPLYATLLKGKLEEKPTAVTEFAPRESGIFVPEQSLELVRAWNIPWVKMCSKAMRIWGFYGQQLSIADTIAALDEAPHTYRALGRQHKSGNLIGGFI
ncbi:MAG: hypothetical protein K2P57_11710 [Burkholderiales bacterium]|nr:hypothetical protein [Burkholderiales bacterium]